MKIPIAAMALTLLISSVMYGQDRKVDWGKITDNADLQAGESRSGRRLLTRIIQRSTDKRGIVAV
jgi:hypothetical protein